MPYIPLTTFYLERLNMVLSSQTYYQSLLKGFSSLSLSKSEANNLSDILNKVIMLELPLTELGSELKKYIIREPDELIQIEKNICIYALSFFEDIFPVLVKAHYMDLGGDSDFYDEIYESNIRNLVAEIRPSYGNDVADSLLRLIEETEEDIKLSEENLIKTVKKASTVEDLEKERLDTLNFLKRKLVDILEEEEVFYLGVLNNRFIYTLSNSTPMYLNQVKRVVAENSGLLTEKPININGKEVPGTIKNWLRDLNFSLKDQKIDSISVSKYLSTNKNVVSLNDKEKSKVEKLIDFYRMLSGFPESLQKLPQDKWYMFPMMDLSDITGTKISGAKQSLAQRKQKLQVKQAKPAKPVIKSTEPKPKSSKSLEPHQVIHPDEKGKNEVKQDGVGAQGLALKKSVDKPDIESKPAITEADIAKKYAGNPAENKKIEEAVKKISKLTGQNNRQLIDVLNKSFEGDVKPDKIKVIAILKLIAETNSFAMMLKDPGIKVITDDYVKTKQLADDLEQAERENNYNKVLIYNLQAILQGKVGMRPDNAARVGLQLANVSKRVKADFTDLAHFDLDQGSFAWNV